MTKLTHEDLATVLCASGLQVGWCSGATSTWHRLMELKDRGEPGPAPHANRLVVL